MKKNIIIILVSIIAFGAVIFFFVPQPYTHEESLGQKNQAQSDQNYGTIFEWGLQYPNPASSISYTMVYGDNDEYLEFYSKEFSDPTKYSNCRQSTIVRSKDDPRVTEPDAVFGHPSVRLISGYYYDYSEGNYGNSAPCMDVKTNENIKGDTIEKYNNEINKETEIFNSLIVN